MNCCTMDIEVDSCICYQKCPQQAGKSHQTSLLLICMSDNFNNPLIGSEISRSIFEAKIVMTHNSELNFNI